MKTMLKPVPFSQVEFTDTFWAPRIETNRTATIPHSYAQLERTGRIDAFELQFTRPVPSPIVDIFADSDVAKWIEAAAYTLETNPDPALRSQLDALVKKVIAAQTEDGYLNTHFIHTQPELRWKNLRDWHELYCAGHLIEAAVAYYQATGSADLLDSLCRYADLIDATFGPRPGQQRGYCGHPEIELALIRLYRQTGNPKYLELSRYFVEERGAQPHYFDQEARERGDDPASFWAQTYEYCQAHLPVRQQEKVVGHAVRAMYLFSAVADLAAEYDDNSLLDTCHRLWDNLIQRRMYLTGGIGPSRHNEGFTNDYDLPDETAYAETCATIGLMLWNQRLLQFEADRKFADSIERCLFNGFLSGVALDGKHFFYENPLASAGDRKREDWFICPCCPPNIARVLASLGAYFYSTNGSDVWVHQYAGSTIRLFLKGVMTLIEQQTHYPWDGHIEIKVQPGAPMPFSLFLRLPGWCSQYRISVNGEQQSVAANPNGYLEIKREWKAGDVVTLDLEMPIRITYANPHVAQLQGRLALERGPLVYCIEAVDNPVAHLDQISVRAADLPAFQAEFRADLLNGVSVLTGPAWLNDPEGWDSDLYRSTPPDEKPTTLTAVPYAVWANRQQGEMRVWLRSKP